VAIKQKSNSLQCATVTTVTRDAMNVDGSIQSRNNCSGPSLI